MILSLTSTTFLDLANRNLSCYLLIRKVVCGFLRDVTKYGSFHHVLGITSINE